MSRASSSTEIQSGKSGGITTTPRNAVGANPGEQAICPNVQVKEQDGTVRAVIGRAGSLQLPIGLNAALMDSCVHSEYVVESELNRATRSSSNPNQEGPAKPFLLLISQVPEPVRHSEWSVDQERSKWGVSTPKESRSSHLSTV